METGRDARGIRSLNRHTLEQIVAASSAAILIADANDATLPIVYANASYERLAGYSLQELAGRPWAALARAAAGDRSMTRPRTNGPRSVIRTVTERPLLRLVTRTWLPNGSVR